MYGSWCGDWAEQRHRVKSFDAEKRVILVHPLMEATRGTAVAIDNGQHCRVVGCTFRNLGNHAVTVFDEKAILRADARSYVLPSLRDYRRVQLQHISEWPRHKSVCVHCLAP